MDTPMTQHTAPAPVHPLHERPYFPEVSPALLQQLRSQLEFYFTPANLERDGFLQSQLQATEHLGAVNIMIICHFPKVKQLHALCRGHPYLPANMTPPADPFFLRIALQESAVVRVSYDGIWLSPALPVPELVVPPPTKDAASGTVATASTSLVSTPSSPSSQATGSSSLGVPTHPLPQSGGSKPSTPEHQNQNAEESEGVGQTSTEEKPDSSKNTSTKVKTGAMQSSEERRPAHYMPQAHAPGYAYPPSSYPFYYGYPTYPQHQFGYPKQHHHAASGNPPPHVYVRPPTHADRPSFPMATKDGGPPQQNQKPKRKKRSPRKSKHQQGQQPQHQQEEPPSQQTHTKNHQGSTFNTKSKSLNNNANERGQFRDNQTKGKGKKPQENNNAKGRSKKVNTPVVDLSQSQFPALGNAKASSVSTPTVSTPTRNGYAQALLQKVNPSATATTSSDVPSTSK